MANQHQNEYTSGQPRSRPVTTNGSYIVKQPPRQDINKYTMPFFEHTLTKHYNPLVDKLRNKYESIYNPLKTANPVDLQIWVPEPSPRPTGGTHTGFYPSNLQSPIS